MRLTRNLVNAAVSCGIALMMAAGVSGAFAQTGQGSAKVVRVVGDARYSFGNNEWHPLREGDIVKPGTVLQTASKSEVDLVLANTEEALSETILQPSMSYKPEGQATANTIRMYENTVLSVDKLASMQTGADLVIETQLDLRAGKIFGSVKKMSGASKYEIKYPNGVAGIRGTVYLMHADGTLSIYSGSALLAFLKADGTTGTQVINAGFMFEAPTGQLMALSTAPGLDYQDIVVAIKQIGPLPPGAPPSAFAQDKTINWASPTTGYVPGGSSHSGGGEGP